MFGHGVAENGPELICAGIFDRYEEYIVKAVFIHELEVIRTDSEGFGAPNLVDQITVVAIRYSQDIEDNLFPTVRLIRKRQVRGFDMQERTHERTLFCVVTKQRGQSDVYTRFAKRGCERGQHLFISRATHWSNRLVGNTVKPSARSELKPGSCDLDSKPMERRFTGLSIEGGCVRPVANKVIALLIFHNLSKAPGKFIRISNRDTTCFASKKIQSFLP